MQDLNQFFDAAKRGAKDQLELNKEMVTDHLDEADRVYLRRNAEAISAAALQVIRADPTQ